MLGIFITSIVTLLIIFVIKCIFLVERKTVSVNESDFSIEYYPLTGRYYPKYKDYYLKKDSCTGIVQAVGDYLFAWADYGETEHQAKYIIDEFKEHRFKTNVKKINYENI